MACFKSGKISIPLFNLFGIDALHYRLLNSRASLVICDNVGLNKIFEIKDRLPDLKKIICIDSSDEKSNVFNLKIIRTGFRQLYHKKQNHLIPHNNLYFWNNRRA